MLGFVRLLFVLATIVVLPNHNHGNLLKTSKMFKIHNCYIMCIRRFSNKCLKSNVFRFTWSPIQHLKPIKTKGVEAVPVRWANTIPPPPGMKQFVPQPIPFAGRYGPPKRGNILIIVPLVTFAMGTWQVKRLKWKMQLIKDIEERTTAEPIPLPSTNPEDLKDLEFTKVIVKGTFEHDNEIFYGPKPCYIDGEPYPYIVDKTEREKYGYNLVTPFVLSDTGERILVNRGWVRTKLIKPKDRPWSRTEGEQTIVGIIRKSEDPWSFGPQQDRQYNIWYYRLIDKLAIEKNCLPIYIDACQEHTIPNKLYAGQINTKLTNNHFNYILTWYGLTIGTAIMYYARFIKK